mgnify:CR=1 FL=1
MRKKYIFLTFVLLMIAGYFLLRAGLPKYSSYYPAFVVLMLLDVYLWVSVRKKVFQQKSYIAWIIGVLYWLPFVLFISLFVGSAMEPIRDWSAGFRTYAFGLVFVAYASKLITVLFLLIADLLRLFTHLIQFIRQKKRGEAIAPTGTKISRSKFLINLGLITGGVAFSGMLVGMVKWAYDFRIKRVTVSLPKLPESFRGFKIVQISDLHLGSWATEKPMKEAVDLINDLKPDLVVFTGDLVNFASSEAFPFEDLMKKIRARHGVYSVLGNHDYGDYSNWATEKEMKKNMTDLYQLYQRVGWKLLRNEHAYIRRNEDEIALIGVENWGAHGRFPKYGDVQKSMYNIKQTPVKLLLSHDPSHWEKVIRRKYPDIDLTFSGHTHGFQFGIDTPGFKWSPAQYVYKQWAGLYANGEKKQYVYVNRGTGFIGYPGRIGILPEITLITLDK